MEHDLERGRVADGLAARQVVGVEQRDHALAALDRGHVGLASGWRSRGARRGAGRPRRSGAPRTAFRPSSTRRNQAGSRCGDGDLADRAVVRAARLGEAELRDPDRLLVAHHEHRDAREALAGEAEHERQHVALRAGVAEPRARRAQAGELLRRHAAVAARRRRRRRAAARELLAERVAERHGELLAVARAARVGELRRVRLHERAVGAHLEGGVAGADHEEDRHARRLDLEAPDDLRRVARARDRVGRRLGGQHDERRIAAREVLADARDPLVGALEDVDARVSRPERRLQPLERREIVIDRDDRGRRRDGARRGLRARGCGRLGGGRRDRRRRRDRRGRRGRGRRGGSRLGERRRGDRLVVVDLLGDEKRRVLGGGLQDAAQTSRGNDTGTSSDERPLAGTRGLARPT